MPLGNVFDEHFSAKIRKVEPMNGKRNEAIEQLERLYNALADDVEAMSEEELIDELEETGEDAKAVAGKTGQLIADAIATAGRRKMQAARAGYEAETAKPRHESNVLKWPESRKRALLQNFAEADSELKRRLTLAARDGRDVKADMDSFIEDLIDLGVIDNEGNMT